MDIKKWKELYDPDIDHLISNSCITPAVWQPQNFCRQEVMEQCRIIDPTLSEQEKMDIYSQLNFGGFSFHVWSKERFSEALSDEELMTKFKKRFERNLPLKYINLILLQTEPA